MSYNESKFTFLICVSDICPEKKRVRNRIRRDVNNISIWTQTFLIKMTQIQIILHIQYIHLHLRFIGFNNYIQKCFGWSFLDKYFWLRLNWAIKEHRCAMTCIRSNKEHFDYWSLNDVVGEVCFLLLRDTFPLLYVCAIEVMWSVLFSATESDIKLPLHETSEPAAIQPKRLFCSISELKQLTLLA